MAGGLTSAPASGSSSGYHMTSGPTVGQPTSGFVDATDVVAMAGGQPAAQTGGNSQHRGPAGFEGGVATTSVDSHLDSLFESTGWTREDILVMASAVQIVMWLALLYLEVTE